MRPLSLGHLVDGEEDEGVVRVIHNTERLQVLGVARVVCGHVIG